MWPLDSYLQKLILNFLLTFFSSKSYRGNFGFNLLLPLEFNLTFDELEGHGWHNLQREDFA